MYLPYEAQETIATELVRYFQEGNMIVYVKRSEDLYNVYGEYTADEVMLRVRNKIMGLETPKPPTQKATDAAKAKMEKVKEDITQIYQSNTPSGAKLAQIREYLKVEPQDN